mmetsp:Transcript_691/g.882  ORF Transcript_691/g.882 Transcript_691/m.882 type:complete len:306 (-) Transcript_691:233-1150(-)
MATHRRRTKTQEERFKVSWKKDEVIEELHQEDIALLEALIKNEASLWDIKGLTKEFFQTAWDYKWLLLLTGVVIFAVASNILLQGRETGRGDKTLNPTFKESPRIPSEGMQLDMRESLQRLRTTVYIGTEVLRIQVLVSATVEENHKRLPQSFYNSVHFGISAWNPFGVPGISDKENSAATKQLRHELSQMAPKPTMVFKSKFSDPQGGLYEEGYVVQFNLDNLRKQRMYVPQQKRTDGKLVFPWKKAQDGILRVARKFGKLSVVAWYPNQWGTKDDEHVNIIQEMFPTRAGLQKLRCNAVAWRG